MIRIPRVPITQDIINILIAHRNRTNIAPRALFRGKRQSKPEGLQSNHIYNWIDGGTKTARKDHLDYVLNEWAKLPDAKQKRRRSGKTYTESYVAITKSDLEELRKFRDLAFTPSMILKGNSAAPEGLTAGIIISWLAGATTKVQPHYLDFVLKAYQELEKHPQRPMIVDDMITAEFTAYIEESGIGSITLLKNRKDIPSGLRSSTVNRWVSGHAATARKDHLDYVRRRYRQVIKEQR